MNNKDILSSVSSDLVFYMYCLSVIVTSVCFVC